MNSAVRNAHDQANPFGGCFGRTSERRPAQSSADYCGLFLSSGCSRLRRPTLSHTSPGYRCSPFFGLEKPEPRSRSMQGAARTHGMACLHENELLHARQWSTRLENNHEKCSKNATIPLPRDAARNESDVRGKAALSRPRVHPFEWERGSPEVE
jgi:hypothetical protein